MSQPLTQKVLIVDDHAMFREVLRKVCVEDFGYSVVAEIGDAAGAIAAISAKKPDLVLLDLALPDGDGFEVMDKTMRASPSTQYLVISAHCEESTVYRVERSPASAFIDKNAGSLSALREALQAVANGLGYFSSTFRQVALALSLHRESAIRLLTATELRILSYIVHGATDEEIAQLLLCSPLTIKTHRNNMLRKLNISSTPKLIAFAATTGLVLPRLQSFQSL